MRVNDLINCIRKLKALGKITGDTELVYAVDDEGNSYQKVNFAPSVIVLDDENEVAKHKFLCIN